MKQIKRIASFLIALSILIISIFSISFPVFATDSVVVINEVCSSNKGENGNITSALDEEGGYCDWIELYNPSDKTVDLSGWGVSDSKKDFYKYTFPAKTTIGAKSFLIVFCSKAYSGDVDEFVAKFGISSNGEKLYLTSPNGEEQNFVEIPSLKSDVTYGRYPDSSADFRELSPTPLKSNKFAQSVEVLPPVLSKESGMYKESISLEMTSADENTTIYYTTDGSDPATSKTRIKYSSPLTIKDRCGEKNVLAAVPASEICIAYRGSTPTDNEVDKGTVIRAVCENANGDCSKAVTKSYFIGNKVCSYGDIPILSVTSDFDNFFGYENGIYCNGRVWDEFQISNPGVTQEWLAQTNATQKGRAWERECHIDLIESDGTISISQDCGMRTQGGGSRNVLQKSLRFFARKEYGNAWFETELFSDALNEKGEVIDKYKTFVVRNGGNDTTYLKYTDNVIQSFVANRDVETQQGRGVLMFLDGEYWGLLMMQEDYTAEYFEQKYGVDADDVVMIKKGSIEIGDDEDMELYNELYNFVTEKKLDETRFAELEKMVDLQSLYDYFATELFIANTDWPGNNWAIWRTRSSGGEGMNDGRWRFILYDTEYSTGQYNAEKTSYKYNNYSLALTNMLGQGKFEFMFWNIMRYDKAKQGFVKTVLDMNASNFNVNLTTTRLTKFYNNYYTHLVAYRNRFHNTGSWALSDRSTQLKNFFTNRPDYAYNYIISAAKVKGNKVTFALQTNARLGGNVEMNTSTISFSDIGKTKVSVVYNDSYSVDLTAVAKDGYVFKKWSGAAQTFNKSITLNADNFGDVKADFIKKEEIAYGDCNDDGNIDAKDILMLRKRLAKWNVDFFEAAADANGDGVINTKDALLMRKYLAHWKVELGPLA